MTPTTLTLTKTYNRSWKFFYHLPNLILLNTNRIAQLILPAFLLLTIGCSEESSTNIDWSTYLGDKASSQYSEADQITPGNVGQLEIAWTYNARKDGEQTGSLIECNPLIVDGVLYGTNSRLIAFAINAATGEELWRFSHSAYLENLGIDATSGGVNRGLVYWSETSDPRILFGVQSRLFALDANTGTPIQTFGTDGFINLKLGLGRDIGDSRYSSNTPGIVFEDLIIMGSSVPENLPAAPGHIRAFNIRTGEQVWRFNTIPHPGEYGYETWPEDAYQRIGGANVWTGMALDEERGLVYCPTGSASYDFYGPNRLGANLFANSLICLDARTGKRVWHYQIVPHDILDYDLPSPPNLFTVTQNGVAIPAVSVLTKQGFVFSFNRVTGEPLFPIEDVPVPPSTIPGEEAWPVRKRPTKPAPYTREQFTIDDVTDISPESHAQILARYQTVRPHIPFQPLTEKQDTIVHPGMLGGAEWGGGAADPNGVLYFNSNDLPAIITVIDLENTTSQAQTIFTQNCALCHGADLKGGTAFGQEIPSLIGISDRLDFNDIMTVIKQGRNTMPAFQHMSSDLVYQLAKYVQGPDGYDESDFDQKEDLTDTLRYMHTGNNLWNDSQGYPAIKPPWGTLNAIDMNTGEYLWKKTFGEYPELIEKGIPPTGRKNLGGPIITAGGVLFIGASLDGYIRAYDMQTGEELWRDMLPFGGFATPSTYTVDGKQYVVIAAGGGRGTPASDLYVAYALP